MTRLALVRKLAQERASVNCFFRVHYFRGVTTVTYSPQSNCIREKTSSTLDVFRSARPGSLTMYFRVLHHGAEHVRKIRRHLGWMLAQCRMVGVTHNTKVKGFKDNEEANRYCYADRAGRHGIECAAYAQFPILEVWISMDDRQRKCTRPRLVFSLP